MIPEAATCILLVAVFLGAIVQGFSGFAFSAVAGAVLLQIESPSFAIPLLMLCSLVIQVVALVRLRKSIAWRESSPFVAGGAGGVLIAIVLFDAIDVHSFRIGFGVLLVLYATWMLLRPKSAVLHGTTGPIAHATVGFAGGLVGGLTAMPGAVPTMWCDARAVAKVAQRSVVQPFIAAMQAFALVLLLLQTDGASRGVLLHHLWIALPALLIGTTIGLHFFGKVSDTGFRKVVCGLLLISGAAMVR